jgi:hypothetical protein
MLENLVFALLVKMRLAVSLIEYLQVDSANGVHGVDGKPMQSAHNLAHRFHQKPGNAS